ncbi:MAG TPA: GntR family transcriptional regulator [Candidatus Eubacterium avistercoris]|uniref:GntR family transcriptional regulator n=1 Tax=Candidatus Eubacterium avistercoris TaxID=2838567 RepID=A0A9D2IGR1_9FIRM|nr:GntR family transcriptional regulator [Candidatus Eubacterium avistercoris]
MFQLNYRDTRPFYEQIKDNLRQLMVTHSIAENEKLPSVRELASSLTINPHTIQKAYRELEDEGYVYTIPGKGTFAASGNDTPLRCRKEMLEHFDHLVTELLFLSVSAAELKERIQKISERRNSP